MSVKPENKQLVLWFLRLFRTFRELDALAQMQAAKAEQFDSQVIVIDEKNGECQSLRADLDNIQAANDGLISDKAVLQDRVDSLMEENGRVWNLLQEALSNERNALRMQLNFEVQRHGGGVPYPEAHSLPANAVRPVQPAGTIGRAARMLPSEAIARHDRQFIRALYSDPEVVETAAV